MEAQFYPLPQFAEDGIWAYIVRIDSTSEYDDTVLEIIQQEAAKYYGSYCSPEDAMKECRTE